MEPVVISETIQEFEGLRYYKCGGYFQRNGARLHRVVWERSNGMPPPPGYDVHHRDENKSNNSPGNLELISRSEHRSLHSKAEAAAGAYDANIAAARESAKAWHSSEVGRAWHSQHAARTIAKQRDPRQFSCVCCGALFEGRAARDSKYCSGYCRTRYRRETGIDNEERKCASCGGTFSANRYVSKKYCSKVCSHGARKFR